MSKQPTTHYERLLVSREKCPRCRGALDTGWECTDCGYDAKPIADELNAEREAVAEMISEPGWSVWLNVDGELENIWAGADEAKANRILSVINGPRKHPVAYIGPCSICRMAGNDLPN